MITSAICLFFYILVIVYSTWQIYLNLIHTTLKSIIKTSMRIVIVKITIMVVRKGKSQ